MATFATTSAANQPPSAGRLMLAAFRAENVPTVSAATTAPHNATAAMSESSRLCPVCQRATQAHTTMEAAPRSVPRKAANPMTPTTMIGSPGSGKSMLAKRIPSILPAMTTAESMETTQIYSIAGLLDGKHPLMTRRPFRSPHHTISGAGLVGGGTVPRPGEISLAHNGLLFLDELAEFDHRTLEIMRQPLEDRKVTITRAAGTVSYPCSFMGAMNPCPCGYYGHPKRKCTCSERQVRQYLNRISGPLLDRFDLHIEVEPVSFDSLSAKAKAESSAAIRQRVQTARELQNQRFAGTGIFCNAAIPAGMLQDFCPMDDAATALLRAVFDKLGLSAPAYDRILKVARTIADLDGSEIIRKQHIAAAAQFRSLDRKYWGTNG